MKLPISLVIITLNEESNIVDCIESCDFVDEVIVVDSFSKDGTVKKAESLGAKVVSKEWKGFGPQKHLAAELAKNDWILSLDADERVSLELKKEIISRFSNLDPKTAYRLPRLSYYLGRWIRFGGWFPDYQTRLFNKTHSQWNQSLIHEKIDSAKTAKFAEVIHHFVFSEISQHMLTNNKYSGLQALEMHNSGKKFSLFHWLTKPWVKFIECYFIKQGFRDGIPGFFIAVSAGYSVFLKWTKLWELSKVKKI